MRKSLLVTDATQPSIIELTEHEYIQIDRLIATPGGALAERQGSRLAPGTTRVALDAGRFCFKALSDTQFRVVQGGVTTQVHANNKNPWPDPPASPTSKGDEPD